MKVICFWMIVMAFGLLAEHAAFAKPNNVNKAGTARKSGKTGGIVPGTKKNEAGINGTDSHRKR